MSEILKSLGFTGDDYRGLFDCFLFSFFFFFLANGNNFPFSAAIQSAQANLKATGNCVL